MNSGAAELSNFGLSYIQFALIGCEIIGANHDLLMGAARIYCHDNLILTRVHTSLPLCRFIEFSLDYRLPAAEFSALPAFTCAL